MEADLERVILNLIKKRPVSALEHDLAQASNRSVLGLRAGAIKTTLELLIGKPLSKPESQYIYQLAFHTMRRNQGQLWDDELPLRFWSNFWRWAIR